MTGPGFPQKRVKVHHPIHEIVPASETAYREDGDVQWDVTIEAGFRLVSGEIGAVNGIQITYQVGDRVDVGERHLVARRVQRDEHYGNPSARQAEVDVVRAVSGQWPVAVASSSTRMIGTTQGMPLREITRALRLRSRLST